MGRRKKEQTTPSSVGVQDADGTPVVDVIAWVVGEHARRNEFMASECVKANEDFNGIPRRTWAAWETAFQTWCAEHPEDTPTDD